MTQDIKQHLTALNHLLRLDGLFDRVCVVPLTVPRKPATESIGSGASSDQNIRSYSVYNEVALLDKPLAVGALNDATVSASVQPCNTPSSILSLTVETPVAIKNDLFHQADHKTTCSEVQKVG